MTTKLAVFFHRLGPYHHARLSAASKIGTIVAIELIYKDSIYKWDVVARSNCFETVTVFPKNEVIKNTVQFKQRIIGTLNGIKPDVLAIPGWGSSYSLIALIWCIKNGVPAILMSESTRGDAKRKKVIETIKTRITACFSAALVGGGRNSEYLEQLGFSKDAIWQGYDAVDNDYFNKPVYDNGKIPKESRIPCSLPENFFLASGRFIEKKNHIGLIQAYARYRNMSKRAPWDLIILGDGPLRSQMEKLVNDLSLTGSIRLPGFKQYDELPDYYASAKAFIHSSTVEQWGLVVNEAMASGLPVLVSNRCGCADDLVQDGVNGYTFDPSDIEGLALLMEVIAGDTCDRQAMGRASKRIIAKWSPETFAENLWKAAGFAAQNPPSRIGIADRLFLEILSRTFKSEN